MGMTVYKVDGRQLNETYRGVSSRDYRKPPIWIFGPPFDPGLDSCRGVGARSPHEKTLMFWIGSPSEESRNVR